MRKGTALCGAITGTTQFEVGIKRGNEKSLEPIKCLKTNIYGS
jgi:hypothetical protein